MSAENGDHAPASGLAGRLAKLARNPSIRGIASVFVMKSSIIVANFALIMLAARVLDTEAFGVFSILFAAGGLFSIVATFGQQVSIMRWWNEYTAAGDPATLKGVLRFSAATVLLGSAIVAAGFFFWAASTYTLLLAAAVTLYMLSQATVTTSATSGANCDRGRCGRRIRQSVRLGAGADLPGGCSFFPAAAPRPAPSSFCSRQARRLRSRCISSSCAGRYARSIPTSLRSGRATRRPNGVHARSSSGSPTGSRPRTSISTC